MRPFLMLPLLILTLAAAPLHWYRDYAEAFAQAQKAQKPLMLFLTRPGCKSCAFMREHVLTDPKVAACLGASFIAAELPMRDPGLPEKYRVSVSPVFTFIDAGEDEIVEQITGGKKAPQFLETLQNILKENPQLH